jgi:predicted transposase/invertase (TIGR01784 family)
MSKYVNPFTDFGFKKIFGDEQNKDILIAFLNELLPSHHQIQTLNYKPTEHLGAYDLDRKVIFDLYCENEKGDKFIVELQKAKQTFFKDRALFYSTFPIREQAEKGGWDFELRSVYCIAILDFSFDEKDPDYLHHIQLKNQKNQIFYDKLMFVFVEVRKFNKTLEELQNNTDKWLYFIKHLPDLEQLPEALHNNIFSKILNIAEIAKFDRREADDYETSLKYYRDLYGVIYTARREGRDEGYDQGVNTGVEIGVEMGFKKAQLATAQKMLAEGFPKDVILKLTGIDPGTA